jgi:hypothetical protein
MGFAAGLVLMVTTRGVGVFGGPRGKDARNRLAAKIKPVGRRRSPVPARRAAGSSESAPALTTRGPRPGRKDDRAGTLILTFAAAFLDKRADPTETFLTI